MAVMLEGFTVKDVSLLQISVPQNGQALTCTWPPSISYNCSCSSSSFFSPSPSSSSSSSASSCWTVWTQTLESYYSTLDSNRVSEGDQCKLGVAFVQTLNLEDSEALTSETCSATRLVDRLPMAPKSLF